MSDVRERIEVENERMVLACGLSDPDLAYRVIETLKQGDFQDPYRAKIMGAFEKACVDFDNVTPGAVKRLVKEERVLDELNTIIAMASTVDAIELEGYISYVREASRLHKVSGLCNVVRVGINSGNTSEQAIDSLMHGILDIADHDESSEVFDAGSIFDLASEQLEEVSEDGVFGFRTGVTELDEFLGGMVRKRVYVVAGRPGMAKTAFAIQAGTEVARETDEPVLFFSLEMPKEELMFRMISNFADIPYINLVKRTLSDMDKQKLKKSAPIFKDMPLYVNDKAGITLSQIIAKTKAAKVKFGKMGMIIVDYLQIMKMPTSAENRVYAIGEVTRALAELAKDLDIVVLLLSQVRRAVEERDDPRPNLSDLRESGNIEQDAGVIVFPYRPFYYSNDPGEKHECEFIMGKNRYGEAGTVYAKVDLAYQRFRTRDINP